MKFSRHNGYPTDWRLEFKVVMLINFLQNGNIHSSKTVSAVSSYGGDGRGGLVSVSGSSLAPSGQVLNQV
jgi:hypothetical protein